MLSDPIVGIDLGTSNTVVARAGTTGVQVLADESGYKIHPSVVSFHPNGGVVVGAAAKQRKVIDPQNTIYSVKRLIGRAFSSPEVTTARTRMPYQIKEGANELPLIVTRGGEFAVPEISAIILDHARTIAAARLGTSVNRAVVTVPASFNDAQRSATATAGAIAGITVVRVLNEPTAAALAYGNTRSLRQVIAVYDFGGGTFDITILKLHDQVYEVLGTAGDTFLGGDDLDERLVDRMVMKFLAENRIDLRTNEVSMMRLRAVAEQTKIELSRRARAVVRIDEIAYGPNGKPLDLQIEIKRDEFVSQVSDLIDRTFPVCKEALSYAGLGVDRIDEVILVGGTSKIPYVRDQVARYFAKAPRTDVNPEDAVAIGAALQATSLERILSKRPSTRIDRTIDETAEHATEQTTQQTTQQTLNEALLDGTTDDSLAELLELAERSIDGSTPSASAASPTVAGLGIPTEIPVHNKPPHLPRGRRTADYPEVGRRPEPPRPDTEYSLPRTGTRDAVFEERTPPPGAPAIGRLKPPVPRTTATGVPAGPAPVPSRPAAPPVATSTSTASTIVISPERGTEEPAASLELLSPASTARGVPPAPAYRPPPSAPQAYPVIAPPRAPVIMEVTPRGLGIATVAGFCEEVIRRNSRLPAEMHKLFTTSRDAQSAVRIVVCQGESRRLDSNVVIGDLQLEGLPPRPRGETTIEVTFALDASGILQVHARDTATGREQRATLSLVGGLGEQDVAASRDRFRQLRR